MALSSAQPQIDLCGEWDSPTGFATEFQTDATQGRFRGPTSLMGSDITMDQFTSASSTVTAPTMTGNAGGSFAATAPATYSPEAAPRALKRRVTGRRRGQARLRTAPDGLQPLSPQSRQGTETLALEAPETAAQASAAVLSARARAAAAARAQSAEDAALATRGIVWIMIVVTMAAFWTGVVRAFTLLT